MAATRDWAGTATQAMLGAARMNDRLRRTAASLFLRGVRAGSRWNQRLGVLLNELPMVFHGPLLERESVDLHYRQTKLYREPANQRSGLLPFEERMLARFFPAPPARLLLPGAGGGRELIPLLDRGYRVTAFEPTRVLAEAATAESLARGGASVATLTVQEWARTASGAFDAVFTGWTMWLHILRQEDRLEALRAFRRVCPSGPVLLSFWKGETLRASREEVPPLAPLQPAPQGRTRRLVRTLLRERLLRLPPLERGNGFQSGFFLHLPTELELRDEASRTGYGLAYYERDGSRFPHAVLLPSDSSS